MIKSEFSDKARQDMEIVKKALNGDEKAFADLLDKYYDSIYFLLLKKTNSEFDAEDLTMETFGKAFNSLHQYRPVYAFSTWLFRIAINNCIDYVRKKKTRPQTLEACSDNPDGDVYTIVSSNLNPEDSIIKKQKANIVNELVKSLKPRYAKLIELRYYKEYSYEEIAEEMQIPLGTVKAQLYRARELLYPLVQSKTDNI
jgi:RNA polymerase sigma factor (sigma-70 family)